jgi:hypothetical protein
MKFGWIALPDQLHALDVLANNWIIGIAGIGALAEFFADKVAWVDSIWDAIHSVVRPIGGRSFPWPLSMARTRPGLEASFSAAAQHSSPTREGRSADTGQRQSRTLLRTLSCPPAKDVATAGLLVSRSSIPLPPR